MTILRREKIERSHEAEPSEAKGDLTIQEIPREVLVVVVMYWTMMFDREVEWLVSYEEHLEHGLRNPVAPSLLRS